MGFSLKKRSYTLNRVQDNVRERKIQEKMKKKEIKELNELYDLNLDKISSEIKKSKAKLVLLQFPDGLKQYAVSIVDYLEEKTLGRVIFLIWFGSCYGACDTPVGLEKLKPKIDLVIQFGHNEKMPKY